MKTNMSTDVETYVIASVLFIRYIEIYFPLVI